MGRKRRAQQKPARPPRTLAKDGSPAVNIRDQHARLRVLHVEDSSTAVRVVEQLLLEGGFVPDVKRVETGDSLRAALRESQWDLVLTDHSLPKLSSTQALAIFQQADLDAPFIIVSGAIGEELAAALIKAGANAYVSKDNLEKLLPTVRRELQEAEQRHRAAVAAKQEATKVQELVTRLDHAEALRSLRVTEKALGVDLMSRTSSKNILERVEAVIESRAMSMVLQPVRDLRKYEGGDIEAEGYEATARILGSPTAPASVWFAEAEAVDLGLDMEMLALRSGIEHLAHIPRNEYLSLNLLPPTARSPRFAEYLLDGKPLKRLVIEISEKAAVQDYSALRNALSPLRLLGLRLAIDDVGAGKPSLEHVLALKPDMIKIDMSIVRNVNADPTRQAIIGGYVTLGKAERVVVIAKGIQTTDELNTLTGIGVPCGQGYLLGRPAKPAV